MQSRSFILTHRFSILIFILTLLIYFAFSNHKPAIFNHHVYLAEAFLNQSLELKNLPPHLHEVAKVDGKTYSIYGITPAIILMPLVVIFGLAAPQEMLAILIGALNVLLLWQIIKKIGLKQNVALWLLLFFAFGSLNFFSAAHDQTYWLVYLVVELFILLSIWELLGKGRIFLVGLYLGLAYMSRPEAAFALLFPLILINKKNINLPKSMVLLLGFLPAFITHSIYNYVRFTNIFETGYTIFIRSNEPIEFRPHGIFSLRYLPFNAFVYFLQGPQISSTFPYLYPPWTGMSILFTSPALLLAYRANFKNIIVIASMIVAILMAIPSLVYHLPGWTQFGWRYSVMFMPFLILITAYGARVNFGTLGRVLVIFSVMVNVWGVLWWRLAGWFY